MRVEELELGRGAVLFELGLPVGLGHGGERTGDGFPFSDAQAGSGQIQHIGCLGVQFIPRLGQSCQATKDDDTKDTNSAANEPVTNALVCGLRPCLLGSLRDGGGGGRDLLGDGAQRLAEGSIGVGARPDEVEDAGGHGPRGSSPEALVADEELGGRRGRGLEE